MSASYILYRVTPVVYIVTQSGKRRAKARRTRPKLIDSNASSDMVNNCSIMVEATVALGLDANSDYRDGKMYAKPHASWIRHETWPRPTQVYRYKLIEHML